MYDQYAKTVFDLLHGFYKHLLFDILTKTFTVLAHLSTHGPLVGQVSKVGGGSLHEILKWLKLKLLIITNLGVGLYTAVGSWTSEYGSYKILQ